MLEYRVTAATIAPRRAVAQAKDAVVTLDIDPAGMTDAMNPAELLLTALAACLLKGIERVAPMLHFTWQSARVEVWGARADAPPQFTTIGYRLVVVTEEPPARLELLHRNLRKYGTISNTLAAAVTLTGEIAADGPPEVMHTPPQP